MATKAKVGIVGAGLIGLSIAYELSSRGLDVVVMDRGNVGDSTSWAATGILPPANFDRATDPIDRLRGFSHQLYPVWAEQLKTISNVDIELERCGGWYLADSPGEHASMVGSQQYWEELSIVCQSRSLDELVKHEPALAFWAEQTPGASAWYVPDEYQVRPPRMLKALQIACKKQNALLLENTEVSRWNETKHSVSLKVGADHQTFDFVVIAGGVWSGLLAEELHLERSVIPIRGQMLLVKTDQPIVQSVINRGNRYVVARRDGNTLIGSCEEEVGLQFETVPSMIEELHAFAGSLIPELQQLQPIRSWAGLRPLTFDGFPMIGPVPHHPRTMIATGHYRSGIHLAPGTAVAIADQITGKNFSIDLDAFRVGKQQSHPFASGRK